MPHSLVFFFVSDYLYLFSFSNTAKYVFCKLVPKNPLEDMYFQHDLSQFYLKDILGFLDVDISDYSKVILHALDRFPFANSTLGDLSNRNSNLMPLLNF